jgi:hypothetical protein
MQAPGVLAKLGRQGSIETMGKGELVSPIGRAPLAKIRVEGN